AISGFLIVHSWLHSRSGWVYLQKRVARIYPAFVVASLFCLIVFSDHWPKLGSFFFFGVCFYLYREQIPVRIRLLAAAVGILILSAVLGRGLWLTLPLCGTYLLFWFAFSSRVRLH